MPRFSKEELIKLQKRFKTDKAIGAKFGITGQAVHLMRKSYGISPIPFMRVPAKPDIPKNKLLRLRKTFVTDRAIGKKLGFSDDKVREMRIFYGIPSAVHYNTTRNEKIVALYKKGMTGIAIAKKFGLHPVWIYQIVNKAGAGKRKFAANKVTLKKKRKSEFFKPGHVTNLGRKKVIKPRISKEALIKLQKKLKTDSAIAGKLGITGPAVHYIRKSYGIPPIPRERTVRISKTELIKLQKKLKTDKAIAQRLGISGPAVHNIRTAYGIPLIPIVRAPRISKTTLIKLQKKLGTDRAIGEEFGITPQAVFYIRKGYGIHPLPGVRAPVPPRISKAELISLQKTLKTDKAIGAKFSITPQAVYYIRKKYGIPSRLPATIKRKRRLSHSIKKKSPSKKK